MASNDLGYSYYTSDVVQAKTSSFWDDASLLADPSVTPGDSPPDIFICAFHSSNSYDQVGRMVSVSDLRSGPRMGEQALFKKEKKTSSIQHYDIIPSACQKL